jgi:hypothetical protein
VAIVGLAMVEIVVVVDGSNRNLCDASHYGGGRIVAIIFILMTIIDGD